MATGKLHVYEIVEFIAVMQRLMDKFKFFYLKASV